MHEFIFKDCYGTTKRIVHPYVESNDLCTNDCKVGELSLYEGMEIIFHFDFGDDWRFKMVVESIAKNDAHSSAVTVIEQRGEPPEQYLDWDKENAASLKSLNILRYLSHRSKDQKQTVRFELCFELVNKW